MPDENGVKRCCDDFCSRGCDSTGRCLDTGQDSASEPFPSPNAATSQSVSPAAKPSEDEPEPSQVDVGSELTVPPTLGQLEPSNPVSTPTEPTTVSGPITPSEPAQVPSVGTPDLGGSSPAPAPQCTAPSERSCALAGAMGNCASGQQACENGVWGLCDIAPLDSDSCDKPGDDANCNGVPNDGCQCLDGEEVLCGPDTDVGLCEYGISRCVEGVMSACGGGVARSTRDCSSADDHDCDGNPDNAADGFCSCAPGAQQPCSQHPGKDGVGSCRAGSQTCSKQADGSARWGQCQGAVGPQASDSCARANDDSNCNGVVAEGCGSSGAEVLWSFDYDTQAWAVRLTDPERLEADAFLDFESSNGDPEPGALLVNMPFDGSNQKIEFNVHPEESVDVSGRMFHARVRLVSGLSNDQSAPGGIKMFAKSGDDYIYISGRWVYLTQIGAWLDIELDPQNPEVSTGDFDPSDVREVGFELRTFSDTTQVSAAVLLVDDVGLSD